MSKGFKIAIIVLLSVIAVALIVLITILSSKKYKINNYTINDELTIDETYDNTFENISLDVKASKVEIKESEDNNIKVNIYGDKEKHKIEKDDKTIKIISDGDTCKFFCFKYKLTKIVLYVPKTYNNELNITSKFGDIKVGNFPDAKATIKLDAGSVEIDSINEAEITNHFGDIIVGGKSEKLVLNEDAGDIKVNEVNRIEANNKAGDIKISKINESLKIDNKAGDIKINELNITEDSSIKQNLGDVKIGKTNDIYIDAKISLGDIKINNNNRKSDLTLKIESNLGDIKVNN